MLPVDRIRFHVIRARQDLDPKSRDGTLTIQLTEALVEERRNTGAATRQALTGRYGFTAEELDRLSSKALDEATKQFATDTALEAA